MPISLAQAARVAGRSRNTLVRAIKAGKLKAPVGENGDYEISEEEVAKLFPPPGPSRIDVLEREVEKLRAQLEKALKDTEEWKVEANAWRALAERLSAKGE
jgi:predicted site-specific integrase-resolvase